MSMQDSPHYEETVRALADGPRGALFLAGLGAAVLLLCWLVFYVLIFMGRGAID